MTATVAIYRIGFFLQAKGERDEKEWQNFVKENPLSFCKDPRWSFYRCAADGFTMITFAASAFAYAKLGHSAIPCWAVILWFVIVAFFWKVFRWLENNLKSDFSLKKRIPAPQGSRGDDA